MKAEEIFSPFGILKKKLPQYSYREGQELMAGLVERAFAEDRCAVVEAGTGIGKSFAYLAPAFNLVEEDPDATVVIATSTITLTKQLYDKDIPFLKEALGLDPQIAILYGRNNYLCLKKYLAEKANRELLSLDEDTPEAKLDKWVLTTPSGSRTDVSSFAVSRAMEGLMSDEDDCQGHLCPYYDKCFFYSARRNAQKARVVITNHHIVLNDAQIRWENSEDFSEATILPGYTNLVVDEAHHLEAEATECFSDKYSLDTVSYNLTELTRRQARFGNVSMLDAVKPFEKQGYKGFSEAAKRMAGQVQEEAETFDSVLKTILNVFSDPRSILFTPEFYTRYRSRLQQAEQLCNDMKSLGNNIASAYESEDPEAIDLIKKAQRKGNMLIYLSDTLRSFIRFTDFDSAIPFATQNNLGAYTISIAPMETGPLMKARLVSKLKSIVYSSATLSVGGNFNYFGERAGLKELKGEFLEGIYPSPFDFKRQLLYLVPMDGVPYRNNSPEYSEYVTRTTIESIRASGGGALVLFTSIKMMNEVYSVVKEELGSDYNLLIQDNRISRSALLRRFKEEEDSCLFATSSFWEGIDAPGNTLRLVIITKLPFDVPTEPINRARSTFIDAHSDRGAFMSLTVPNAVIKMKQGVGRLIRNEEDKGIVLILDSRIVNKGYGNLVFSSLPDGYLPEDCLSENVPLKVERFLY